MPPLHTQSGLEIYFARYFDAISDDYTCIYVVRDPIDRFESHITLNINIEKKFLNMI